MSVGNTPSPSLRDALDRWSLAIAPDRAAALEAYCHALWQWNAKLNLTRHTDFDKFVTRDLVDSLALSEFIAPGEHVLDVGSGGGVPGVVLAVLRDDIEVELSESVGKKARVLDDLVARLGLRLPVHHDRAETVLQRRRFDTLTVRAVARLRKLLEWFKPHWERIGQLLVIKGPSWVEERGEARHHGLLRPLALRKLKVYTTPDTGAHNVLLRIAPKREAEPNGADDG